MKLKTSIFQEISDVIEVDKMKPTQHQGDVMNTV